MSAQRIIYALVDPRTEAIRYVGKSSNGLKRPRIHLCPSLLRGHGHKEHWLRGLLAAGFRPEIRVLKVCATALELEEMERAYVTHLRETGVPLTNATRGGEGRPPGTAMGATTRARISAALRGRKYGSRAAIRGGNHPCTQLTEADVIEIRRRRATGVSQQSLADVFGVSQYAIGAMCSGKTWRHVTEGIMPVGSIHAGQRRAA